MKSNNTVEALLKFWKTRFGRIVNKKGGSSKEENQNSYFFVAVRLAGIGSGGLWQ